MVSPSPANKQAPLPCPSWILPYGTNVHIAKDRSWFPDDYTPITSFITDRSRSTIKVVGIGTVEIPTKVMPAQTGPKSHRIFRLKNVLHVPRAFCNIIGNHILRGYGIRELFSKDPSDNPSCIISVSDGRPLAYYFKSINTSGPADLWEIQLSKPPIGLEVGPSPFRQSEVYLLNASWPDSEREKITALLVFRQAQATSSAPLTLTERAWLKKHYGSEFKFLVVHWLNIFKDEHREEGRAILRALMSKENGK